MDGLGAEVEVRHGEQHKDHRDASCEVGVASCLLAIAEVFGDDWKVALAGVLEVETFYQKRPIVAAIFRQTFALQSPLPFDPSSCVVYQSKLAIQEHSSTRRTCICRHT
jgi:hypothetical protein